MKILHISPMYYPALGGAELHLKELSEVLRSRGHEVTVVTANVRNCWDLWPGIWGDLPEAEVINGVKVLRLPPNGGWLGLGLDRWLELRGGYRSSRLILGADGVEFVSRKPLLIQLIPYLVREKADIVASMNWYWPPAYHAYLARKLKRFTLVGIPLFHTARAWCHHAIYNKMLASCDAVVVNTTHEGNFVQERGATRVEVAGVGIHATAFDSRNGGQIRGQYRLGNLPVVGFVGRQEPKKGVCKLVEAMKAVWKWNQDVRLVLAGFRSHQHDEVEATVQHLSELERQRIVRIDEFAEKDKGSIYDAFDVFALPSTEESFGLGYLEAWLCKKPVIGARIGSTQCVIDEGIDGLLVDHNDASDIAGAIIKLLSNRNMREKMGTNGQAKTLTQFTWDKVTDKVENLYLELVAGKGTSYLSLAYQK